MARNTQKNVTFESQCITYDEHGTRSEVRSKTAVIGTEDDYIKIYFRGLEYIRDMPSDCFALLCILMKYTSYADEPSHDGINRSFIVHIDKYVREAIASELDYKQKGSISNLLTELVDGEILARMANGVYRLNPYLFGRGKFRWMADLRQRQDGFDIPRDGDTYMNVYKRNYGTRRLHAELQKAATEDERQAIIKKWNDFIGPRPKADLFK